MFDLISNHLLTLMIFLPVAGAFILLFIRNADAVRRMAITVARRRNGALHPAPGQLQFRHGSHAVHRERRVGQGLEHLLQARRRRHQRPVRRADHPADGHLDHGLLDRDQGPGARIHGRHAVPRSRHGRRLRGNGPLPVLHLLGSHADPHVPPDRRSGAVRTGSTPRSSSSCTPWSAAC